MHEMAKKKYHFQWNLLPVWTALRFDFLAAKEDESSCSLGEDGLKNAKLGIEEIGEENPGLSASQELRNEKPADIEQGVASTRKEEKEDLQVNTGERAEWTSSGRGDPELKLTSRFAAKAMVEKDPPPSSNCVQFKLPSNASSKRCSQSFIQEWSTQRRDEKKT